ncbi:MAG: hypothetical protein EB830_02865 [Nitrosopumilus sp. H13]|nr:MAG: hypothetical protein EB830_02865 [Nitrosopumilus sp. H13]
MRLKLYGKNQLEEKHSKKRLTRLHIIIIISIIGAGGLLFRLSYLHVDIPVIWDALLYFWYANDIALLDALPLDHTPANNGWPIFLSFFFQVVDSNNYIDYMLVQRLVGSTLSVLTVIPVYLMCRKFFPSKFALIGPAIFAFDPRIVGNSLTGYAEPLFVLLTSISIVCFLSSQKKIVFFVFPVVALAAIVRGEGIILIIPYTILYIIRFRHSRKTAYEIPLLVILFILVLTPMITYRIDVAGTDAMFMRALLILDIDLVGSNQKMIEDGMVSDVQLEGTDPTGDPLEELLNFIRYTLRYTIKMMLLPLVIFVPYGLYRMFKNMEIKNASVITILFFMTAGVTYIVQLGGPDQRYALLTVPILCIFGVFFIEKIASLFSNKDLALVITVGIVIASSVAILEQRTSGVDSIRESIQIGQIISEKSDLYVLETQHLLPTILLAVDKFPILSTEVDIRGKSIEYCPRVDPPDCGSITNHADIVAEFLKTQETRITHLVIDGVEKRNSKLLIHIFENEDKYTYLTKIYDSSDDEFSYRVKIFEIDYDKFDRAYPHT